MNCKPSGRISGPAPEVCFVRTMRKLILLCLVSMIPLRTTAQNQDLDIGLGIILGSPSGLSAKLWTGEKTAVAAAAGYHFGMYNHISLSADFLAHLWTIPHEADELKVYFGMGAGMGFLSEISLDIRFPGGVSLYPGTGSLELFAELVPALQLFGPEDLRLRLLGYLGTRWYF